jgi:predicted transcriptional regulator
MRAIGNKKGWRAPTLISFLVRLEDRGFIRSEKVGKERQYYPIVSRKAYMVQLTRRFLKQYHGGSLMSFLDNLAGDSGITTEQYDELLEWLKSCEF